MASFPKPETPADPTMNKKSKMFTTATYHNRLAGKNYELVIELLKGEKPLEAAWNRGIHTAVMITGWNIIDINWVKAS